MTAKAAFNTDEWNLLRGIVPLVSASVAAFSAKESSFLEELSSAIADNMA